MNSPRLHDFFAGPWTATAVVLPRVQVAGAQDLVLVDAPDLVVAVSGPEDGKVLAGLVAACNGGYRPGDSVVRELVDELATLTPSDGSRHVRTRELDTMRAEVTSARDGARLRWAYRTPDLIIQGSVKVKGRWPTTLNRLLAAAQHTEPFVTATAEVRPDQSDWLNLFVERDDRVILVACGYSLVPRLDSASDAALIALRRLGLVDERADDVPPNAERR